MCRSDAPIFAVLARSVKRCVSESNGQNLANTAWACAIAGQLHAPLLIVLARAAERYLCDFNAQNLANTAWPS